jgi:molecular chaperone DnaK
MTWLAEGFLKQHGIDLRLNKYCLQMLKEASERAKIDVGRDGVAKIHVEGICQDPTGKVMDLDSQLTEAEFNRMVMDLVQRTFKVCDEALQSAKMTAQDLDAIILVGGPTRLPIIRTSVKHYFGKDVMAGIDPDEVVAMGAAIQANSLMEAKGEGAGSHYPLDVTPLTLRVGTVGGYTDKIIDKNTPIPIERSKSYTTNRDGQEKVKIRVYQGESNKAADCEMLGEFEFSGFRIGYRGEVRIEVTFEIDTNGIVNVTAADVETGQKTSCTIRLSSGLTEDMIKSATEKNARTTLARGEAAA